MFNLDSFNTYRQMTAGKPLTAEEARVKAELLANRGIVKAIGMRMLTDDQKGNDLLGYMLLAGGHTI